MIYYRHYEHPNPNSKLSNITLAGKFSNDTFHVGVALCNHKDQFSRKTGREIAERRLANSPLVITSPDVAEAAEAINFMIFNKDMQDFILRSSDIQNFAIEMLFTTALVQLVDS